jgi:hypothetical protein
MYYKPTIFLGALMSVARIAIITFNSKEASDIAANIN